MFDHLKAFWAHPFDSDEMSVPGWFAFIGLLIVCAIIWRVVLAHILEGIG